MKRRRKYTFRGTPVYAEVGVGLKEKARKGELGDYGFVAGIMAIPPSFGPTCYEPAWDLLDEMAEDDVKADRPMLSALVVKLGR